MPFPIRSHISQFARDDRGAVAVLFGLFFIVILMCIGLAVDYARTTHAKSEISAAADAAALAAGRALMEGGMTDAEIAAIGVRYFNENLRGGGTFSNVADVRVIPNRADSTIEVQVNAGVPMTFMRVAGFQDVDTSTDSFTTFEAADLELSIALDVTGSMCNRGQRQPCGSARKLDALKAAATDLVDTLLTDEERPNMVRIGLAPYSASVQLGEFANAASDGSSTDGCVRERAGSSAHTDDSISVGGAYRGAGSLRDIDPTEGLQGYFCPEAEVVPLTADKALLNASIDGLTGVGSTAGHIGAQWAWNIISPNFTGLWPSASAPADYDDGKTTKAVILMTDGIFNMAYENDRSSVQALSICSGLGAKGVRVHTVAFEAPESAKTLLRSCAEQAGGEFHEADDGEALRTAFVSIARSLNSLRLTQ
jgi:Flp pilus assembly protein TadG